MKKKPRFLAVDFFSGAGGATCGLINAGGYVIAGIDKDGRCAETFTANNQNLSLDRRPPRFLHMDIFPRTKAYPDGQQTELFRELKSLINYYRRCSGKNIPILFAICAPCQPFTRLSQQALTKERSEGRKRDMGLLQEANKFVAHFKPEIVLSENVSGIRQPEYRQIWDAFQEELRGLGYRTGSKVVCTSRFGIPQNRKRSILLGIRKKRIDPHILPDIRRKDIPVPDADPSASPVSVRIAIGHLPPIKAGEAHETIANHRARALSPLNKKRLRAAKPGDSNRYMENTCYGDLSLPCHRRANKRAGTRCFSDVYTRMHPDRPAPTITTKCHSISNGRFGHYDRKQVRGISLREAAILQSFPEEYCFHPTDQTSQVAQMIGNAVPPRLVQFYSDYLIRALA